MKRLVVLLLVLIGLGVLAWKLSQDNSRTTIDRELIDFIIPDTASVNRIFIAKTDGSTIDLNRKGDHWTVNNEYKAKKVNVDLLLKTFNRVEVRGPVPASARETVIKNMSAKGTKVEIYMGGDKPEKTWIVGTSTQDHLGTYMLLETDSEGRSTSPFVMGMSGFRGYLTPRFHTILEDWRDSEFIAIPELNDVRSYSVKNNTEPEESFTIELAGGRFTLRDHQDEIVPQPDTGAVAMTLVPLKKLHYEFYETYFNESQRDSVMQSTPVFEIEIELIDGTRHEHVFWKRKPPSATYDDEGSELPTDPDRIFSKSKYGELIVLQRHLLDRALPLRSDLLP